jgi:sugar (pentulose or hexulose) kinase
MTFLGLDLGTSFIKGAVLRLDPPRLGEVHRAPFPGPIPGLPEWSHEVDAHAVLSATRQVIDRLLPLAPGCQGIFCSGQMGGLILTNNRGEPLSNYISWQDKRLLEAHPSGAGTFFDVLKTRITEEDWRVLGREVRPGYGPSLLFWLAQTGRWPARGALAASLPDWVIASLCATAPVSHVTQAVGALNLETGAWHTALFHRLGLEDIGWPRVAGLQEPVGTCQINGHSLPCYPAVGDHPCALAGAGLEAGELSLNISTGSQVSMLTPRLEPFQGQTRPWFDGRFLKTITHLPAGRALNVLVNLGVELARAHGATLADPWPYFIEQAQRASESGLRVQPTFFPGPFGDTGSISGVGETNLRAGPLFRAALAGMAEYYFTAALRLDPEQGWRNLVLSGGLALKIRLLRELIADRFARKTRVAPSEEDALEGLLTLAAVRRQS